MMIGVGVQGLLADRYQLQELLGRGAMGEVRRASDQVLGRLVAVKLLRAEEAADAERFRLEAQTAARLNHPNVVGMYDFGSHHDQLYLVMELVDGWSLAQERSLRGALAPAEAAAITAQAAAGLSAAHQQGVIHRDIKPANVMLTADRTVKIADFGIARFAEDAASTLTATGKILGTADYLAPERALGRPAQPASDVYSLGCVLYELLTGRPPFSGATSLAVVQQHVGAKPAPPERLRPDIPQPLSDYVLHLLAKDPAHRPTAEQAADWLSAQHGTPRPAEPDGTTLTPTPAIPPPPAPHTGESRTGAHSRPRGRRKLASRAVVCGVGLALFAGAAALGASLNSGDNAPASPTSPTTVTSIPARQTPAPTPPSATRSATTPPAQEHGGKESDERSGKHGDGKDKGRHSDG
ncbi:serine/threonine protein kinase [Streptomyces sp. RLA2-12]|nr:MULTISPECIES: serine/threonine-protein kinase [unclassified Streptomyces]NMI55707.1 serine/threonine protein kinase [Streptomyces sp. RLA2-12]QDN65375.1 serine/threonine protein kinase [Streptomyces sp. S1D4-14]QDO47782.1 serine/threonine protein kinase [Streptomyces sp. RLB3-5]QDN55196.1 serine/threonine protein kinase [Streptomyces sp. S1D4-20]QDO58021.1 serine/threonine protein kinase [Streptomyces sp. RLB1-8]